MENYIVNLFFTLIKKSLILIVLLSFLSCQMKTENKQRSELIRKESSVLDTFRNTTNSQFIENAIFADTINSSELTFDNTEHHLGSIIKGTKENFRFSFSNSGNNPLILYEMIPSCGCTNVSFTKEPILPGEKGQISVTFDSSTKNAGFHKIVLVIITNSFKKYYKVIFKVNVIERND
ncbi:MAG: DUF1573 domain-containing protein [Bacteroidales bacterium]|nr:DUF1573 domain-containing protein [Bacteroidales bacterium]